MRSIETPGDKAGGMILGAKRANRSWAPEEDKQLREMLEAGLAR